MKNLVKHTQNTNAVNGLWNSGDMIIIGVSGGPDSMCLLDVMACIAKKEALSIIVAHVNYSLRGDDSHNDQLLVQEIAKKHGFVCEVSKNKEGSSGNEALWRDIRYEFFAQLKEKHSAQAVAVAHTKNDQAETILLHLLRGSGLSGLVGMQMKSPQGIIRPFLGVQREDVINYCGNHNIQFYIDKTNEDNVYMRNKIRNELLPYLEKGFNPQIIDVLSDATTIISDDYEALYTSLEILWTCNENGVISFSSQEFMNQHISLQRIALRKMIEELLGSVVNIEKGFIEEMRKMISSNKGKIQQMKGRDLKMLKKGDRVELACRENF